MQILRSAKKGSRHRVPACGWSAVRPAVPAAACRSEAVGFWRKAHGVCLLLCLLGCHRGGDSAPKEGEKKEADVRVRVKSAERRTIADRVTGLGRCEAIPDRFAVLTAAIEGRVTRLLKQPGDTVEAGCAIVELDSTVAEKNLKEKEAAQFAKGLARRAGVAAEGGGAEECQAGDRPGAGGGGKSRLQRRPPASAARNEARFPRRPCTRPNRPCGRPRCN